MAVYTDVSDEELQQFLAGYTIGSLLAYKGIAEGVENSNYLLHTSDGFFILTLYEKRVAADDLPFFLGLIEHLAARGFIVELQHPEAGVEHHVGNPLRMSLTPQRVAGSAPCLGADTAEVLSEVLGLDPGEISPLFESGICS